MRIGIFDSGLGGLIIAKSIVKAMPQYDYVYLGDTKRVPYGNRSHEAVYQFTREAVDYLFKKENCALVILACNTASARALRRIQKDYKNTNKKVLGTSGTVSSGAFPKEILKLWKNKPAGGRVKIFQNPAPLLVPLAEEGETKNALPFIKKYLQVFLNKKLDALVLGCTHYPIFKQEIKKLLPRTIKIISQDEIVPKKLKNYLARHQEISKKLSKDKTTKILVTDMTQSVKKLSQKWFGKAKPKLVSL